MGTTNSSNLSARDFARLCLGTVPEKFERNKRKTVKFNLNFFSAASVSLSQSHNNKSNLIKKLNKYIGSIVNKQTKPLLGD